MQQVNNHQPAVVARPWFGAVVFGWLSYLYTMVRGYIHARTERISHIGNELVANARKDLSNLKTQLDKLWNINDEDKQTMSLYISAILGNIAYTPIIIGVTVVTAAAKLSAGSVCMVLGGDWYKLLTQLADVVWNLISEGLNIAVRYADQLLRTAFRALVNVVNEIASLGSRILTASIRALERCVQKFGQFIEFLAEPLLHAVKWFCTNFARLFFDAIKFMLDTAHFLARNFVRLLDVVFTGFEQLVDFVVQNVCATLANIINAAAHVTVGVLRALGLTTKGVLLGASGLVVETPVVTAISGTAKSSFVLTEALAASLGALMDALVGFVNSVVGFRYVPKTTPITGIAQITDDSDYYTHAGRDNMHAINNSLLQAGNYMLSCYEHEKRTIICAHGWEAENAAAKNKPKLKLKAG